MKIAQLSTCTVNTPPIEGYGGTEWVASYLTERLVALGHDVTLFATSDSTTQARLWSWFDHPAKRPLLDEITHVGNAYEVLRSGDFDIIHNHTYLMGPMMLCLSQTPSVSTVHNGLEAKELFLYGHLSERHHFVSISESQRALAPEIRWAGTVYNGIETDHFPLCTEKDDYLLFVGMIAPAKGPHFAVQVALASRRPLKLAGPIQPGAEEYFQKQIAPFVDGKVIQYLGEVSLAEKIPLYQRAAALLVPICWNEPFGLVMVEAMSCGTPVIAFARGSVPEIIVDKQVGFIVENVTEMARAVAQVSRISPEACREHVARHFSAQRMAEGYVALYEKLLAER